MHATAREHYTPLKSHLSWTKLILKFIADPSLGFAPNGRHTPLDFRDSRTSICPNRSELMACLP
ncbi:MAG: hypothetical protein K1X64_01820 [Myxococcaceae bacterium]|nr:hypothetical protein [Myxococcaceae bacterium]